MFIQALGLKSFRSFTGVDLPIDSPRVFIAGLNGTGKTTIKGLVQYVLRSRCQGLDDRGSGQDKLVPTFAEAATVSGSLTIKDVGTVERTWSAQASSFRVSGFTGDSRSQQAALLDKLGTSDEFLMAVLDSRQFLGLHHAEAKALVLALLNVRIKIEGDETIYTLAQIDEMYAEAFDERKVAKKALQGHFLPSKPIDSGKPQLEAVDARLAVIRKELEEVVSQIGVGSGQRLLLQKRQAALSQPMVRTFPVGFLDQIRQQIEEGEERLSIMESEASETVSTEADVSEELLEVHSAAHVTFLRSRVEALKAHKPKEGCVIESGVECPVVKQKFTARAKAIEAELDALPEAEATPEDEPQDSPITVVRLGLDKLRKLETNVQKELDAIQERATALEAVTTELEALPDTSAQEAAIAGLRDRIEKGMAVRRDAEAHWKAVGAYSDALEARQGLVSNVERLEGLCATLGPSGIRVQALGSAMGTFEGAVNEFTKPYGWTVTFMLEPWGVVANGRAIETYSESEQYRIGVAIQLAIAMLSGLKFAIVDELDLLDEANRNLMAGMLLTCPLDQVIILAKREVGQPLPVLPQMPGRMVAYRLHKEVERSVVVERQGA